MKIADKLTMFSTIVGDMPKAKEFYAEKLGLEITKDYRQDDEHWWVSLAVPEDEVTITLTTFKEGFKQGTVGLYFETSDVEAAHQELVGKGVKTSVVQDDLYGPGSGVRWFNLQDPDGNLVHIFQA